MILLVLALIGAGGYSIYNKVAVSTTNANASNFKAISVSKGDINVKISGTGTVQPISRYDIVPLVKGTILKAPFEQGMKVKEGDSLYLIDDSDLSYNIEKTKNSIEKLKLNNQLTEEDIKGLELFAPIEGRLKNFSIKDGEQVGGNNKIAEIVNDKEMTAVIPFNSSQIHRIKVGQRAVIVVPQYMTYIDGTITYISDVAKPSAEGTILYDVEIQFDNPGIIAEKTTVSAIIKTNDGEIHSPVNGTVEYSDSRTVNSKTSGTVNKVYVRNNEWVEAGQKLLDLENDNLLVTSKKNAMDLKDLQISLDSQIKQFNDYNILSPINGTVISKNYKAGDTINTANSNTILMTVADMSKMTFTIDVDELDIAKIKKGQQVHITADALPNINFSGEVTGIPVEGKSQNGVTTYPVEVTISKPGDLRPGMNVNADIMIEGKQDVLYVPMAAVTKMGDKAFVWVKSNGTETNQGTPSGQQRTSRKGSNDQSRPNFQNVNSPQMDGMQRRVVEVGINNEDFIEIISGLNEGDTVYIPDLSSNQNQGNNSGFGGFSGGMRIPGSRSR